MGKLVGNGLKKRKWFNILSLYEVIYGDDFVG